MAPSREQLITKWNEALASGDAKRKSFAADELSRVDPRLACEVLEAYRAAHPEDGKAYAALGFAYYRQERYAEAIAAYDHADRHDGQVRWSDIDLVLDYALVQAESDTERVALIEDYLRRWPDAGRRPKLERILAALRQPRRGEFGSPMRFRSVTTPAPVSGGAPETIPETRLNAALEGLPQVEQQLNGAPLMSWVLGRLATLSGGELQFGAEQVTDGGSAVIALEVRDAAGAVLAVIELAGEREDVWFTGQRRPDVARESLRDALVAALLQEPTRLMPIRIEVIDPEPSEEDLENERHLYGFDGRVLLGRDNPYPGYAGEPA